MYQDSAASRKIIFPQLEFSKLPELILMLKYCQVLGQLSSVLVILKSDLIRICSLFLSGCFSGLCLCVHVSVSYAVSRKCSAQQEMRKKGQN